MAESITPDVVVSVKSIVSASTKKGLVELEIGEAKSQLSVQHARAVALLILDGAMAAESDEALVSVVSEHVDQQAAAMLLPLIRAQRVRIQDSREAESCQ